MSTNANRQLQPQSALLPDTAATQPALRLVDTRSLSRADWLQARKRGIGSSDAAAAVGLNPYQSQLELWLIKTGRDHGLRRAEVNDEDSPMYWGTLLEPIVVTHYTRRTGNRVRCVNAILQHSDPKLYWMLANIDRAVVGNEAVQILECKTAGEFGSRLWRDGIPQYVQLQVQHQLAVTGKAAADVAVLVCGQELRIERVQRDEVLIARLIALEHRFWQYVESDTPPPADGSDSAAQALQCLYPEDNGTVLDLRDDTAMSAAFADLVAMRKRMQEDARIEAQLKQRIQQYMGEATRAQFEQGAVSWKRSKDGTGLDTERLLREQPELASQYPLVKPGSRRFLVQVEVASDTSEASATPKTSDVSA